MRSSQHTHVQWLMMILFVRKMIFAYNCVQEGLAVASIAQDVVVLITPPHRPQCAVNSDRNLKPKLAIMRQCTSVTDRRTDGQTDGHWHRSISARCTSRAKNLERSAAATALPVLLTLTAGARGAAWEVDQSRRDDSTSQRRLDCRQQTTDERRRRTCQPQNDYARPRQPTTRQDHVSPSSHEGPFHSRFFSALYFMQTRYILSELEACVYVGRNYADH